MWCESKGKDERDRRCASMTTAGASARNAWRRVSVAACVFKSRNGPQIPSMDAEFVMTSTDLLSDELIRERPPPYSR